MLVTLPGITKISSYDVGRWGHYWSFTALSTRHCWVIPLEPTLEVASRGNVLTATAFLHGLASEELSKAELEHNDLDYEVILTAREKVKVIR